MKKQTVTSKGTSINRTKLPAIYGKITLNEYDRVLDYGCGRYTDHIRDYVKSHGCDCYYTYDPYNKSKEHNEFIEEFCLDPICGKLCNVGIISNVLNVIDSDDAIKTALEKASTMVSGKIYITVYEGDRSGVGRYTGKDSYQRNMRLKDYIPMLEEWGYAPIVKNGMIILED